MFFGVGMPYAMSQSGVVIARSVADVLRSDELQCILYRQDGHGAETEKKYLYVCSVGKRGTLQEPFIELNPSVS